MKKQWHTRSQYSPESSIHELEAAGWTIFSVTPYVRPHQHEDKRFSFDYHFMWGIVAWREVPDDTDLNIYPF